MEENYLNSDAEIKISGKCEESSKETHYYQIPNNIFYVTMHYRKKKK